MIGPGLDQPCDITVLNAVLNAITVVLTAWLVNRRRLADRRENGKNGNGHGPSDGPGRPGEGFRGGHPPGIQP